MSATGIGAAVRRKEDIRFITGNGHYTDDVVRPGETRAVFVRSPHAHAKIKKHRRQRRQGHAGRHRRAHRRAACRRQGRRPDLRLDDPFQGRLADEDGAASGDRGGEGQPRRRRGRGGDRRDAGRRPRRRRKGGGRLRSAAGGHRSGQGEVRARRSTRSRPRTRSTNGRSATRRRWTRLSPQAKHVTKLDIVNNRLVPNAIEPRVALAEYDRRHRPPDAVEHLAEPARGAARHRRLRRHRAGAQAARHRARRRRRLRLQDLHLSGGGRLPVGGAQGAPAGEMDGRPQRSLPHRRAWPRPRHPCRTGARRERQDLRRCARTPSPISAPTCRPSRRRCRPISTPRCCRASTTSRRSIARSTRSTPTPRRWTPIAAPGGRKRPSSSSGWSKWRRARWGSIRPTCASATSSRASRTRRR